MNRDKRFQKIRDEREHSNPAPIPGLKFVPALRVGELVFLSGEGPRNGSVFVHLGKVGSEVGVTEGQAAAYLTGLNLLYATQELLGSLNRVKKVVEVFGMVNSAKGFTDQPRVVNGLSSCLLDVLGDKAGSHTRSAVGMAELPFNICFEARMTLQVTCEA